MKKLLAISFFSIFLFAQFGKVISYAYCKWETSSEVRCDCEKILAHDDHENGKQLAKLNVNANWEDPLIADNGKVPSKLAQLFILHIDNYSFNLAKGFADLPYHPPSALV